MILAAFGRHLTNELSLAMLTASGVIVRRAPPGRRASSPRPSWRQVACLLLCGPIYGCHSLLPGSGPTVTGIVVADNGQILPTATVRLQGTALTTTTDARGRFEIRVTEPISSKYLTAWKPGFFNGGEMVQAGAREYRIVLKGLPAGDNAQYRWTPPRRGASQEQGVKACEECHAGIGLRLFDEWEKSAHARSATNPMFLEFFTGSEEMGPLISRLGYKKDFPHSNGSCATCHVPAMALNRPFDSDPRMATGVAREGIFCDFCHKVQDVTVDDVGGHPGTLSMKLKRPEEGQQLFFGPLDDVHPGPDAFSPIYGKSQYCAACHDGRFWNLLVYSEFQEWSESSYAKKDVQCQNCHMKPDGRTRRFALETEGGVLRDPASVASHALLGIGDVDFMREAVKLSAKADVVNGRLQVTVSVSNVKAGHHIPTGSPMRNMVLRVDAWDTDGKRFERLDGDIIPQWAGSGLESEGNYAGLPGKGYAKVLKRWPEYLSDNRALVLSPLYPSPFWRPTVLDYDNRIPANGTDTSAYSFKLPAVAASPIQVSVRLIYRKTFKSWLIPQAAGTNDLLLANESLTLQ